MFKIPAIKRKTGTEFRKTIEKLKKGGYISEYGLFLLNNLFGYLSVSEEDAMKRDMYIYQSDKYYYKYIDIAKKRYDYIKKTIKDFQKSDFYKKELEKIKKEKKKTSDNIIFLVTFEHYFTKDFNKVQTFDVFNTNRYDSTKKHKVFLLTVKYKYPSLKFTKKLEIEK